MAAAKRTLNIFEVLKQADNGNYGWYDTLTEEQRKEFNPWLTQRWISSVKLNLVNEITNPLIKNIPDELAWRLFCAIGVKGAGGYKFPGASRGSRLKTDVLIGMVASHYEVSRRVAATYMDLLTKEDLLVIAEEECLEKADLTKIKARIRKL